jgi:hypothetical protein
MIENVDLVRKTLLWYAATDRAFKAVGGVGAEIAVRGMSDDLVYTMVANNLSIVPQRNAPTDKE